MSQPTNATLVVLASRSPLAVPNTVSGRSVAHCGGQRCSERGRALRPLRCGSVVTCARPGAGRGVWAAGDLVRESRCLAD